MKIKMVAAMDDIADYSTTRTQFAEAALVVLAEQNLLRLPADRAELMDEITEAMSDTERTGSYPVYQSYAEAILAVVRLHNLLRGMNTVEIWAKGYADATGLSRIIIADDADPAVEARKRFGSFARVVSVRPLNLPPVASVDEVYARLMSRNDNS